MFCLWINFCPERKKRIQCDILLPLHEESGEARTEYFAVRNYYDQSGQRRQERRTAFSSSEAKRIARELENEHLEGGEMALYSDNLTFQQLANHCHQAKYCEAEYDESGNNCLGFATPVFTKHT